MATVYNLNIPQDGTFKLVIDVPDGPEDLTGYTGLMHIRPRKHTDELYDEIDSAITVNPNTRQITLEIPDTVTAGYTWDNGVYDLLIDGPLGKWRVMEGFVRINHSVTRED